MEYLDIFFKSLASEQVLTVIMGSIGAAVTAFTSFYFAMKKRKSERNYSEVVKEMSFQKKSLDFSEYMNKWGDIDKDLKRLMKETEIDRFVIFKAWNGDKNPKWTTSVFQYRIDDKRPTSYIHFELDRDYVGRIQDLYEQGVITMKVDDLPESFIKSVYKTEGVKSSLWAFIDSKELEGSDSKSVTYCSFSAHGSDVISDSTEIRCRALVGRLKGMSEDFK